MKKLIHSLCLFIFFFQCAVYSQEVFLTNFDSPFHELTIDSCWDFDDQDTDSISFELRDDWDIEFDIEEGKILKKKANIEKLYEQIKKARGKASEVSLLVESFPLLHYLDLLGYDIQLEDYQIVKINGIKAIKAYHKERFPIEIGTIDEPEWTVYYVFIIGKRLYSIDFVAPASKFLQLEPFFEATLKNLFK